MMDYDQVVYQIAIQNGFNPTSAKFVVAQARLESSDYSSNVFKNNNNMFGMKFINQPLATQGTPAPKSEQKEGYHPSNYYAKYASPVDSVKDAVERLYSKTFKGVTPSQLKNAQTPQEFADLLKQRSYYGTTASKYAAMISSKLRKINIMETLKKAVPSRNNLLPILVLGVIMYYAFNKVK